MLNVFYDGEDYVNPQNLKHLEKPMARFLDCLEGFTQHHRDCELVFYVPDPETTSTPLTEVDIITTVKAVREAADQFLLDAVLREEEEVNNVSSA